EVLLDLDVQLFGLEAGDGDLDPVRVIAGALDVVGRVAAGGLGRGGFEQARKSVEADDGAVEGREVEGTHQGHILLHKQGCVAGPGRAAFGLVGVREGPGSAPSDGSGGQRPRSFQGEEKLSQFSLERAHPRYRAANGLACESASQYLCKAGPG